MNVKKCMIIDDEKIARDNIRDLLGAFSGEILIIGEACNGIEAVEKIRALSPDLIFLDVQMPGLNGFEVIRELENPPLVVFATAYDEYALSAFRANAIDYLLKPIGREDILRSVNKIRQYSDRKAENIKSVVEQVLAEMKTAAPMTRIKVTVGDTIRFIPLEKVMYFEADEKYTTVCSETGTFLIETPLYELENSLPTKDFIRIHRKQIVNINHILEIKKWFDRKLRLKLRGCDKKEFVVSRNFTDKLKAL
jgi:two-component system LytT family response regulator